MLSTGTEITDKSNSTSVWEIIKTPWLSVVAKIRAEGAEPSCGANNYNMTLEQLKENLCEMGYEHVVIFEDPDYAEAFIGISNNDRAVYDYEKMIECLSGEMSEEDAIEFIDYNTIRSLSYVEGAPIIVFSQILRI